MELQQTKAGATSAGKQEPGRRAGLQGEHICILGQRGSALPAAITQLPALKALPPQQDNGRSHEQ